ncbi:MAG: GAF domain-containing protein [Anaerolineae bacterium]|nr:GAF domain-containing protein [Anaerolineae bacterium]
MAVCNYARVVTQERQQARQAERRQFERELLTALNTQISHVLDVEALVSNVCSLIEQHFRFQQVFIYLKQADQERLLIVTSEGLGTHQMPPERRSLNLIDLHNPLETAVLERRPVIRNNILPPDPLVLPGTRAQLVVPMVLGEALVGLLEVQDAQPGRFSEEDAQLIATFTTPLAIAIQNAQHFDTVRKDRELADTMRELTAILSSSLSLTDTLEHLLLYVWWIVAYDAANFMFLEGDTAIVARGIGYFDPLRPSPLAQRFSLSTFPLIERVVQHRMVVSVPDTAQEPTWKAGGDGWIRSWIGAPIVLNREVIGVLALDSAEANRYTLADHEALLTFANSAAIAIGNARLYEAEKHQRELAETLRDIGVVLTSTLDPTNVMERILEQVRRLIPYEAASVRIDQGDGIFVTVAALGYEAHGLQRQADPIYQRREMPLRDEMRATRQPIILPNVHQDPRWIRIGGYEWIASWAGMPIITGGRMIGEFDLDHATPYFYTEKYYPVLAALGTQISIAVGNALFYEAERRRRLEMEAVQRSSLSLTSSLNLGEVLAAIVSATIELTNAQDVHIFLLEDNRLSFGAAWYAGDLQPRPMVEPRPGGITWQVATTGEMLAFPHADADAQFANFVESRAAALLSLPLRLGELVVGVMNIAYGTPRQFPESELRALRLLANQASIAIQNANLFRAMERERQLADTLRDIGLVISSTLDQRGVLENILAQIARALPYDAASVWLDEHSNNVFWVAASIGYDRYGKAELLRTVSYPASTERIIQRMHSQQHPIIIPETQDNPDWLSFPGCEWVRSSALVPILVREEVIGLLRLDHHQPHFYTPQQANVLVLLGTQISVAVGNARYFEAEIQRRQELETVQRSSLSLTALQDLPQVLLAILNATLELTPAHDAYIFLYDGETLTFGASLDEYGVINQPHSMPTKRGITYTVARRGTPEIVPDVDQHPMGQRMHPEWRQRLRAMISLPLKFHERVVGVMNIAYRYPRYFRQTELNALALLVSQASIAIENARLFRTVQDQTVLLEGLVQARTGELDRERAQLKAILDAMGEGVIYIESFTIIYVNQALIDLSGYDTADFADVPRLLRRALASPQHTWRDFLRQMTATVDQQGHWRGELHIRRADGTTFDASVLSTRVTAPSGQQLGYVSVLHDISQDKALQAQRDRFIANASHELRTPLANFKTRLYLLHKRPQDLSKHLSVMEEVADQMTRLVQDLLDVSRFERGVIQLNREPLALPEVVMQVVEQHMPEAHARQIRLLASLPATPLEVAADRTRLVQVLTNLLFNALTYTGPGGQVRVELTAPDATHVLLAVEDTGIGIAPELISEVFKPFFRAVEGTTRGTGLGLTITREIVELHGGSISVQSQLARAAALRCACPACRVARPNSANNSPSR